MDNNNSSFTSKANNMGKSFSNSANNFGKSLSNSTTNFGRSFVTTAQNTSWFLIVLIVIILLIILIIIIVVCVKRAKKRAANISTIISAPVDAFDLTNNSIKVDNSAEGLEFTYSVWIYIQDWTRGWKNIFVKGDKSNGAGTSSARAPGLWLYPDTNALHARINTFASPNEGCDIKNIPLQKWVNIVYVLNNRTVDIYIDGKLERSCVLRGVPKLNDEPLHIADNGGFFGKISNLVYYKYALKPDDVYNIYSNGPY